MVARIVIFLLVLLVLTGCDPLYGPKLRNELGFTAELIVSKPTGDMLVSDWPMCRSVFLGAKGTQITNVAVLNDGKELLRISRPEIEEMMRQDDASSGYRAWVVRKDGVHFSSEQFSRLCPVQIQAKE